MNLRRIRNARGWSQARLARESGVSVPTVERIERDSEYDPRISRVTALAAALGVTVDELISHDPESITVSTGCGPTRDAAMPASESASPIHTGV